MKASRFSWFADILFFASMFGVQFNSGTDQFADRVAAQRLVKQAKQFQPPKHVNHLPTVVERDAVSIAMWTVVVGVLAFLAVGAVLTAVPTVAHAETHTQPITSPNELPALHPGHQTNGA